MPKEYTIQEVGHAFEALKKSVEDGSFTEEKRERIELVLDAHEDTNQKLTAAIKVTENHETEIKAFKEELEKKGTEAGKMREQVDKLEIALAKSIETKQTDDYHDSVEYKAFDSFIKGGPDALDIETKVALRTDKATEGGVLVISEMETRILKKITEIDPIRSVARVRPTSKKSLVVPVELTIPVAQYEGEAETGTDSVATYGSETLTAFRLTHTAPITRDMLMDSSFDMESEIMDASARAFAFGEGAAFVSGSGHKEPFGFLTDSRITQVSSVSGTGGTITGDDILNIQGELKEGYIGTLVMNRRVLATLRQEQSASGGYLWDPGLNGPRMSEIGGSAYILANSMPDAAVDSLSLAYGDFGIGYLIIDRTATEVIRDDLTLKKKAMVEFTIHRWNTGKVVLPEAIKILKLDA